MEISDSSNVPLGHNSRSTPWRSLLHRSGVATVEPLTGSRDIYFFSLILPQLGQGAENAISAGEALRHLSSFPCEGIFCQTVRTTKGWLFARCAIFDGFQWGPNPRPAGRPDDKNNASLITKGTCVQCRVPLHRQHLKRPPAFGVDPGQTPGVARLEG